MTSTTHMPPAGPQTPPDIQADIALAEEAYRRGRHDDAITALSRRLGEDGGDVADPHARAVLQAHAGRAALAAGKPSLAVEFLAAALDQPDVPDWTARELEAACLAWKTAKVERVPTWLEEDLDRFCGSVRGTLRGMEVPEHARPRGKATPLALAILWLRLRTCTVEPAGLSSGTRATLAKEKRISPRFLEAAAAGPAAVAEACFDLITDVPFVRRRSVSPRLREIAAAARLGAKPVFCPFSGTLALSRTSMGVDVFGYWSDDRTCVVVQSMDVLRPAQDGAWLLLEEGLILAVEPHSGIDRRLATALALVFSRPDEFRRYASRPERRVALVESSKGHVGHDLWNYVSAWPVLFSMIRPEEVGLYQLPMAHEQLYGGLTALYPEAASALELRVVRHPRRDRLILTALREGFLVFATLNDFVSQELASRVLAWARGECPVETRERVARLRAESAPLVMITLRLGNREWIDQEEGCVSLVRALAEEFPQIGVVLDGLNTTNTTVRGSHALMSVDAEQALAQRIIAKIGSGITVHNSIGCPLAESLLLAESVDVVVSPLGAGMAKTRWIANKPCVAYANRTMLDLGNLDGSLYDLPRYRETPAVMRRVPRDAIGEAPSTKRFGAYRENYRMDWRALHQEVRLLLLELEHRDPGGVAAGRPTLWRA